MRTIEIKVYKFKELKPNIQEKVLDNFREIKGIRSIKDFVSQVAPEQAMINISDRYLVSGFSEKGGVTLSVVIDGRILSKGDTLDGMTITDIKPGVIFLKKDGVSYRIDY